MTHEGVVRDELVEPDRDEDELLGQPRRRERRRTLKKSESWTTVEKASRIACARATRRSAPSRFQTRQPKSERSLYANTAAATRATASMTELAMLIRVRVCQYDVKTKGVVTQAP